MKAYVTSIGERTTEIVCWQLNRLGFDAVLLDKKEPWVDKYKRFIMMAKDDCLRIDADIIPNEEIKRASDIIDQNKRLWWVMQFKRYGFYLNKIHAGGPLVYAREALEFLRGHIDDIPEHRPEAMACRFPGIVNKVCEDADIVVGYHGFYQTMADLERHKRNKMLRGQIEKYDFELAEKIVKLYE